MIPVLPVPSLTSLHELNSLSSLSDLQEPSIDMSIPTGALHFLHGGRGGLW